MSDTRTIAELDQSMRCTAMDMALKAQKGDDTPDSIVARARAFLQFLTASSGPMPAPPPDPR